MSDQKAGGAVSKINNSATKTAARRGGGGGLLGGVGCCCETICVAHHARIRLNCTPSRHRPCYPMLCPSHRPFSSASSLGAGKGPTDGRNTRPHWDTSCRMEEDDVDGPAIGIGNGTFLADPHALH